MDGGGHHRKEIKNPAPQEEEKEKTNINNLL